MSDLMQRAGLSKLMVVQSIPSKSLPSKSLNPSKSLGGHVSQTFFL